MKKILEAALQEISSGWRSIPWEWRIEEKENPDTDNPETVSAYVAIHVNPNKAGERRLAQADAVTLEQAYVIMITWMVTEGLQRMYLNRVYQKTGILDLSVMAWPADWSEAVYLNQQAHAKL